MTEQPTPHEFTEDVGDYSMCVCGTPALTHHLIEQPTPHLCERCGLDEGNACRCPLVYEPTPRTVEDAPKPTPRVPACTSCGDPLAGYAGALCRTPAVHGQQPTPRTVRRHVYDGERCRFCGINVYDEDIDGSATECVNRPPLVHTSETPRTVEDAARASLAQRLFETPIGRPLRPEQIDALTDAALAWQAAQAPTVDAERIAAALHRAIDAHVDDRPFLRRTDEREWRIDVLTARTTEAVVATLYGTGQERP